MDGFDSLPPLLQYAIGLGFAAVAAAWFWQFLVNRGLTTRAKGNEAEIALVRIEMANQLKAKEDDYSKKLEAAKQAFSTDLEIKEKRFLEQVENIAKNFADQESGRQVEMKILHDTLDKEKKRLITTEKERDELREALSHLNNRLDDVEKQLRAQTETISEMRKTIGDKDKEKRELQEFNAQLKKEVVLLQEEKVILVAEKNAMLDMALATGIELKLLRQKIGAPELPEGKTNPS